MKKKLFFLLVLLLPAAFAFAQSSQPETPQEDKGMFLWTEETHDFGNIDQGIPAPHKFTFKNVGKAPITISNVKPSCGCTGANWTKEPIPPGGEGFVEAKYNAAREGAFNKALTVTSDAQTPTKVLYFKGKVLKKENLDLSGGSMLDTKPQMTR